MLHQAVALPSIVLSLVLLLATACGGSSSEAGPDAQPSGPATYLDYVAEYNTTNCARKLRCETPPPYESVQACVDELLPSLTLNRQRIADSIDRGITTYTASAAAACLSLVAGSCDTSTLDIYAACADVISGTAPVGDSCIGHFECDSLDGTQANGPWCFEGCTGLFGSEETLGAGTCVEQSPATSPECS